LKNREQNGVEHSGHGSLLAPPKIVGGSRAWGVLFLQQPFARHQDASDSCAPAIKEYITAAFSAALAASFSAFFLAASSACVYSRHKSGALLAIEGEHSPARIFRAH
jgi:hypothetical protein